MLDIGERTGGCWECGYCTCNRPDLASEEERREMYAEANELLKALNMEPIEVPEYYTEEYLKERERRIEARYAEMEAVHTCKPSYKMQQTEILSAMKSAWNDWSNLV